MGVICLYNIRNGIGRVNMSGCVHHLDDYNGMCPCSSYRAGTRHGFGKKGWALTNTFGFGLLLCGTRLHVHMQNEEPCILMSLREPLCRGFSKGDSSKFGNKQTTNNQEMVRAPLVHA